MPLPSFATPLNHRLEGEPRMMQPGMSQLQQELRKKAVSKESRKERAAGKKRPKPDDSAETGGAIQAWNGLNQAEMPRVEIVD
jgi:hypothetical protein